MMKIAFEGGAANRKKGTGILRRCNPEFHTRTHAAACRSLIPVVKVFRQFSTVSKHAHSVRLNRRLRTIENQGPTADWRVATVSRHFTLESGST